MNDKEESFKQMFLSARKGEVSLYRDLLTSLAEMLRNYLMKTMNPRLRSMEQVEDLVQDVLIAIHEKRDLYDENRPFFPWVFAIARYRLIDSLRQDARRPECVEWVEAFEVNAFFEMPKLPEEESGEEWFRGLSQKQKKIVKLAKIEEMPLAEIASLEKMSLSAVKVALHRAIQEMRKRV